MKLSSSDPAKPARRTRQVFAVIPTLLTLGNAVCGFGAITFAAMVGPEQVSVGSSTANQLLFNAAGLIYLAMVFDALDGSVARLTKQTSDFGAQLDSLCDVVSFGVAPAFIMLKLMHPNHRLMESIASVPFQYAPRLLWAVAVLFMVCAILRLARFNAETDEADSHEYFSGLPSPAAAGVIASFPIGLQEIRAVTLDQERDPLSWTIGQHLGGISMTVLAVLLPIITVCVSFLMVSRIRYPHVVNQFLRRAGNRTKMLKIVFSLLLVFVIREMALPVLFCYFAFAAPVRVAWTKGWGRLQGQWREKFRSTSG
jgi:CDP-diacylglycerol---serine O-phosphatidyltransferase